MTPSSFLLDKRNGEYILFFGGLCTCAGLKLFPPNAIVSKVRICADQAGSKLEPREDLKVSDLISYLTLKCIGLYDFSCIVDHSCKFSTHDDSECHFESNSIASIRSIFDQATPPVCNSELWRTLEANPNCYVVVDDEYQLKIYSTFDALVDSTNAR